MTPRDGRMRIDIWLWRVRLAKTRAEAARWIGEGGVRLIRAGIGRRLDKPSALVAPGDTLVLPKSGAMRVVTVEALPARRGPPAEGRAHYGEVGAESPHALDDPGAGGHFSSAAGGEESGQ